MAGTRMKYGNPGMREFKRICIEVNSLRVRWVITIALHDFQETQSAGNSVQSGKCGTQIDVNSQAER